MKPAALLLLLLHILIPTTPADARRTENSRIHCLEPDREALLSIKQYLVDASNRLSSWTSDRDCCKWVGISCDNATGHVKELTLSNSYFYNALYGEEWETADDAYQRAKEAFEASKLRGKINPSLLRLKHLTHLDLSYNDFSGNSIPTFFGSLENLRYLNLTEAGFEGMVPHQLGNLSSLLSLSLRSSYDFNSDVYPAMLHVDNLKWAQGLSSLERLDLSYVNLSQASDWLQVLSSLPSLTELNISSCKLQNIPSVSFGNFTSLSILDMSQNTLNSGIPEWILNLKSVVSLDLSVNFLTGPIPSGLSKLTSLRYLDLSTNNLVGSIPNSFFTLKGLVSISLRTNNLEGQIPCGFLNMTSLKTLLLSWNNFNSSIPTCLYGLRSLETLDLSHNGLQGGLSNGIGDLTSLVQLFLSDNRLEGEIPKSIGSLCRLKEMDVSNNKFVGEVSDAFQSLSSGCAAHGLESLNWDNNLFFGHMRDDQFEGFPNLRFLHLKQNNLSGPIPISLGGLSNLRELYLRGNHLEGIVSELHFLNLTNLVVLDASGNSLILKVGSTWIPPFQIRNLYLDSWQLGQFPVWLKSQKWIIDLELSSARISDTVPFWFWNLSSSFVYLNLSHNQISGQIPKAQNFCVQCSIFLGSNLLDGPVPYLGPGVVELDLFNNSLSGDLSDFLCNHKDEANILTLLHLGENQLSGVIPDCWNNWASLETINLRGNNLTGEIPRSIGELLFLKALHLRNNNLSGRLPPSLRNCASLLILDIAKNKFSGRIPRWIGSSFSSLIVLGIRSNKFKGEIPAELCLLTSLQIFDAAGNNLSGKIPKCINNFTAMAESQTLDRGLLGYYGGPFGDFLENAYVVMKGSERQYDTILTLVTSLDLSGNNLSGEIPKELTSLVHLLSLNLSSNNLEGKIPDMIGDMKQLESLDLSRNKLDGKIPASMSRMNFLGHMNLSYNMLSGEIPGSTQMQSFEASCFIGNKLCGPPLTRNCSGTGQQPRAPSTGYEEDDEVDWLHVYMALGYAVGFGGVCFPLILSRTWRDAYFWFLGFMWFKLRFVLTGQWFRE